MKTLKDVLGDGLYSEALNAANSLKTMGVSVSEMTRDDLAVSVALLIREIQRHPTHAEELARYGRAYAEFH